MLPLYCESIHIVNTKIFNVLEGIILAIITHKKDVLALYTAAAEQKRVIPCFCTENLTTTEAILSAAQEYALTHAQNRLTITLAITAQYGHRSQACNYTHTRHWKTGLALFLADAQALMAPDGPFPNVDLLLHLDHIQHDVDLELLHSDLSAYSSIMYDASNLPFEENIQKTAEFVARMGDQILIEGACDEIFDATGEAHNALTTPENARRYKEKTGVDLMVANLGTEHRASTQVLHYYDDVAREIQKEVGPCLVLHGLSSVSLDQLKNIYKDGICKVNIWTMLERDAAPALFTSMVENAEAVAGPSAVKALIEKGLLSPSAGKGNPPSLAHFTTVWRQDIIFGQMKNIVRGFLDLWYH